MSGREFLAIDKKLAGSWLIKTKKCADGCSLAAAVTAEEAKSFSLFYLKREIFDNGFIGENHFEMFNFNDILRRFCCHTSDILPFYRGDI